MRLLRVHLARAVLLLPLLLAACSGLPTQEMSEARRALQAARAVDAGSLLPFQVARAQSLLDSAEAALARSAHAEARQEAVAAKSVALEARELALALAEARRALAALPPGAPSSDALAASFEAALSAAAAGDSVQALRVLRQLRAAVAP